MGTLLQDITSQANWLVKAFKADGLPLNYSLSSFKILDDFYDRHTLNGVAVPGGRLEHNSGPVLFSIGAYMGETFIKLFPGGQWQTDDADPQGEINAAILFPDGSVVWPMQRAMKRFQSATDGLYAYGYSLSAQHGMATTPTKPWWKFW
jgi:hypothetical protein